MKVLFFTIGDLQMASSRTRIYEFLPHFEGKGVQTKTIPFVRYLKGENFSSLQWMSYYRRFSRILSVLHQAPHYDVIVVQRLMIPRYLLSILKRKNQNLILDLDDAIYANLSPTKLSSFHRSLISYKAIIVSNSFLKDRLESHADRVIHLPTCVNTSYFRPASLTTASSKVKIGWVGTSHTEKYLSLVHGCFRELQRLFTNVEFHIISTGNRMFNDISLVTKRWSLKTELKDLGELDIGIMPLTHGHWEQAKSGYKILQYLALGIPVVASGVGVNTELVKHGETGFIANTEEEWLDYLSLLIQDRNLRHMMGEGGRKWVVEHYDHQLHFNKFYDVLKGLLNSTEAH